ncbi:MAG: HAD-IA family hydrolase [Verrucomicrobiota bacterium]|jgi:dihydrofolate synthase/folylpolyglutamate synthase
MSYTEAIQFLYDLQLFGMKLGLENAFRLAALAGNPQAGLRFIHVAGTNGKGSTCAMLEGIYRAAGLRVGLFTSPHLVSFAERIQVDRRQIGEKDVARLVEEMRDLLQSGALAGAAPTFFEVVTVMALRYFAEQHCQLVIWETGLGGRLDATNIVTPLASVITNIQLDHQQWLGETVAQIAREKAGIIKPGIPVITAAADPAALEIIAQTARARQAPLEVVAPGGWEVRGFEVGLAGEHQKTNAAVALTTARVLREKIPVSKSAIRAGLKEVRWPGRLQTVRRAGGQTILLDGAHNPAGAQALAAALPEMLPPAGAKPGAGPALILGTMRDKDYAAICGILAPLASKIFLSPIGSDRTADPVLLAGYCRHANPLAEVRACANLAAALEQAAAEPFIIVTGSIHFVGEAMEILGLVPASTERALNDYHPSAPVLPGSRGGSGGKIPPAPRSSILAVTLDVGGTLIEPWPSVGHVFAQVASLHGLEVSPDVLNRRFAAAWKAKKDFSHTRSGWSELVDQTFAGLAETPPSRTFFPALYDAFALPSAWRIYEDVLPCLEELRRRGLKLGAISNWDERLRPLLQGLKLDIWFDSIVISAETGRPKPDPAMFRRAAGGLKTAPASILHVGDSRRDDFAGARAAGFRSLLLKRGAFARPGREISALNEVLLSL